MWWRDVEIKRGALTTVRKWRERERERETGTQHRREKCV